jgi:hypothetical protein
VISFIEANVVTEYVSGVILRADVLIYVFPSPFVVLTNGVIFTLERLEKLFTVEIRYPVDKYPNVPRPFTVDMREDVEM